MARSSQVRDPSRPRIGLGGDSWGETIHGVPVWQLMAESYELTRLILESRMVEKGIGPAHSKMCWWPQT